RRPTGGGAARLHPRAASLRGGGRQYLRACRRSLGADPCGAEPRHHRLSIRDAPGRAGTRRGPARPEPHERSPTVNRLLILLLLPLVLESCTHGAPTRAVEEPVPVRIAPIVLDRVALPVTATGTLGPKEDVALSFKIGGVIARILVDEGQAVRTGQLLATLDQGEIDPAVAQAQSAAEKAER